MATSSEDNDFLDFLQDIHGDVQSLRDEMLSDAVQTIEKKAYRAYGAMQNLEKRGNGTPAEPIAVPVAAPVPVITDEMPIDELASSTEITEVAEVPEVTEVTQYMQWRDNRMAPAVSEPRLDPPKVISGRGADFFSPSETKTRITRRPRTGSK